MRLRLYSKNTIFQKQTKVNLGAEAIFPSDFFEIVINVNGKCKELLPVKVKSFLIIHL
jgi:hypothetical protein